MLAVNKEGESMKLPNAFMQSDIPVYETIVQAEVAIAVPLTSPDDRRTPWPDLSPIQVQQVGARGLCNTALTHCTAVAS